MSIELIVLDVDGTLTDGRIIYDTRGMEYKSFNVKDGLGITSWIKLGKFVAIITGRRSNIVQRRAEELGIVHCYQNIKNKKHKLDEIIEELGIGYSQVAAIGDDWNDYDMLNSANRAFAPIDATESIKDLSTDKLDNSGGDGAVREMIDILIKEQGLEPKLKEIWLQN